MIDPRTGIIIEPSRDDRLTPFATKLLQDHYLREGETPQEGYARACKAWSDGDNALAQRLYEGVSRGWFMFASPVLSNAPLPGEHVKGMPISCFLTYVGDSLEELMDHSTELRWLSVLGGGVGGHWSEVRSVSDKAPGPIPFLHTANADMEAYSQGKCYTPDTQVITSRGWVRFDELREDDYIGQVNSDLSLTFVKPIELIVEHHVGDIINVSSNNKAVNLMVTPNHSMVVERKATSGWQQKLVKIRADALPKHNEVRIHTAARINDDGKGLSVLSARERFLIALQADGSLRQRSTGCDFHFAKTRKIDRLREILNECGYSYSENNSVNNTVTFCVGGGVTGHKKFSDWIQLSLLSGEWCDQFLNELAHWDAHECVGNKGFTYSSTVKENADFVQAIAALAGRTSRMAHNERDGTRSDIYTVYVRSGYAPLGLEEVSKVTSPYNGKVYCALVESGMLLVRRDGVVTVCGNTRRGSYAAYMNVSHPDIMEFLSLRKIGGDEHRKCMSKGFHHGVNITDDFMRAVKSDGDWCLIDPHDKSVRTTMRARVLWHEILETRYRTGEPYLYFIDTARRAMPESQKRLGLDLHGSNLCVAPETLILTDNGYFPISSLADQKVTVWNGNEWSETVVKKTGDNQRLIKVLLSDGSALECTPYHKFYLQSGYMTKKSKNAKDSRKVIVREASSLQEGDTILKFTLPVVDSGEEFRNAYANGFYSADGTTARDAPLTWLYGEKRDLAEHLMLPLAVWKSNDDSSNRDSIRYQAGSLAPKFTVPVNASIRSRLEWLAGYCDGDGAVARNGDNESLQMASVNLEFLNQIKLLLNTLGVQPKIEVDPTAGSYAMPDGHGALKMYDCQEINRLLITSGDVQRLLALGFTPKRLKLTQRDVQRDASHFIKVVSVEDHGRIDNTYCFNEPIRHMGVFNGILTGNCSEITLVTGPGRTAVCCLSSMNAETFSEWRNTSIVADVIRMLDNVLTAFINTAPAPLANSVYSARMERSLGLGLMGFHSYLQRHNVAFESVEARKLNKELFSYINSEAVAESKRLAVERGEPKDMKGTGRRNAHLIALAPNANSAILANVSPATELNAANAFAHEARVGLHLVKNFYLEKFLIEKGMDTDEIWSDIIRAGGSVQHLDFLTDHEKAVFKTANETSMFWVIKHAADRQPYICQSQSVNLFYASGADKDEFQRVHMNAWESGLKSLYYCRTRASNRAEDVSKKIERVALQDSDYVSADDSVEEDGCKACEG